jgi:hypothetical protein
VLDAGDRQLLAMLEMLKQLQADDLFMHELTDGSISGVAAVSTRCIRRVLFSRYPV